MKLAHAICDYSYRRFDNYGDYREILRLNSLKYTQRQIAASVHSSRNTISEVIQLAAENNLC